jgi:PAS domain S-box-containing protein
VPVLALHSSGRQFPVEVSFSEFLMDGRRLFAAFVRDVTVQSRLQAEARRVRELLDATQKIARVGGWEQDLRPGGEIFWTDQMFQLIELPPRSFVPDARAVFRFMAPESVPMLEDALAREAAQGVAHDLELVMVTARGRRFWVHTKASLTLDDGRLVKRTVTVRDITLQKTAQQAQRQAWALQKRTSEQLELALKGAQVALWVFEVPTGRVTHAQRWEMFGYTRVPPTFEGWKELIHPDDVDQRLRRLDEYFSGQTDHDEAEYRMRTQDGSWVWVRARGQVVSSTAKGEPLQYAGVVMDISAQVAARQVVRDQTRFVQAMVDGIDTGVLVADETALVYANDCAQRMLGYDDGEGGGLTGLPLADVFGPEHLVAELERRRSLAHGIAVPTALWQLRRRDGATVGVALNSSRVEWGGRPHYIYTARPLSDHDSLEAQIRATQVRFDRVLISELEAQQAHIARELHDSLGSELAGLSLVLGAARQMIAQVDARLAENLNSPMAQVKAAVEVSRALARGLMPVGDTPGGLRKALERLARDHEVVRGIPCDLYTEGEVDGVRADVGNHLYRIVQEALNNAVRHGGATALEIHLVHGEREWSLTIIDDGQGFDPADAQGDHIGLGLRSMMARAKVIGGGIQFRRRRHAGTEVCVTWPDASTAVQADR